MPVYNSGQFVGSAIESILQQTFANFEFIIVDDGSNDSTQLIIKRYAIHDRRIICVMNDKRIGIVKSLNKGVLRSKGLYIARMDSDDLSFSRRFEKQVGFLDTHPDYGVIASTFYIINDSGKYIGHTSLPLDNFEIIVSMLSYNPITHGSVMFRRELVKEYFPFIYKENQRNFEDFGLWSRLIHKTKFYILKEPQYAWRIQPNSITSLYEFSMSQGIRQIQKNMFPYIYTSYLQTAPWDTSLKNSIKYNKTKYSYKNIPYVFNFSRVYQKFFIQTIALLVRKLKIRTAGRFMFCALRNMIYLLILSYL